MDAELFAAAVQIPLERAERWATHLNSAMDHYGIRTYMQRAAFLSQTAHESAAFQRTLENLNYSTPERIRNVWPFRFKSIDSARPYVRNPMRLGNYVYANRLGNGDESSGDGFRYRGRGLIQLTGLDNYREAQKGMGLPVIAKPEMLEQDEFAAASAAWWWHHHNLNYWADQDDIDSVSGYINRGDPTKVALGQDERRDAYMHALFTLEA
jgi:putative chitinase